MRIRPPSDPSNFIIRDSEVFETAVESLKRQFPLIYDALDDIEWVLRRDPRAESTILSLFEGRELRIHVTPRTPRYPKLRVLLEINGNIVTCWHIAATS